MKMNDKHIEGIIKSHENLQRIMANRISDQDNDIANLMGEIEELEERLASEVIISESILDNMIDYMRELIFDYKDKDADLTTHPLEVGFLDGLIEIRRKKIGLWDKLMEKRKVNNNKV